MSTLSVDTIQGKTTAGTLAMPAGTVVQTTFHSFATATDFSSNSDADVGGSTVTFTPKFASSILILTMSVSIQINRNNSNNGGTINFVVDGVNISHPTNNADYEHYINMNSGNTNLYTRTHKEVSMNASNTNAKTVKLVARPHDTGDSGVFRVNPTGYFNSTIKIQEIAQ